MRLVDADKLLEKRFLGGTIEGNELLVSYTDVVNAIRQAPTVDAVEIVRCKDCAHYIEMQGFEYKGRKTRHCVWHSALRGENDYCSDSIRRSNDEQRKAD